MSLLFLFSNGYPKYENYNQFFFSSNNLSIIILLSLSEKYGCGEGNRLRDLFFFFS